MASREILDQIHLIFAPRTTVLVKLAAHCEATFFSC